MKFRVFCYKIDGHWDLNYLNELELVMRVLLADVRLRFHVLVGKCILEAWGLEREFFS